MFYIIKPPHLYLHTCLLTRRRLQHEPCFCQVVSELAFTLLVWDEVSIHFADAHPAVAPEATVRAETFSSYFLLSNCSQDDVISLHSKYVTWRTSDECPSQTWEKTDFLISWEHVRKVQAFIWCLWSQCMCVLVSAPLNLRCAANPHLHHYYFLQEQELF